VHLISNTAQLARDYWKHLTTFYNALMHPIWQGIWEEFQQSLQKINVKYDLPLTVHDIISEGYQLSCNPMLPTQNHFTQQASVHETPIQQQANLGWKQLLYGQVTGA